MNKADPENIEDIVQRARLGDAEAFSVLYKSYFAPLYRYVYFRVSDKLEAEDLTQEIFLKAYGSFHRYNSSGQSPLAYLYTIARNTVIDHYRKRVVPVADEAVLEALPDKADTAEEAAAKRGDYETVRLYLTQLPKDQQDAIALRFIEGYSTREVAAILGKSEATVRQLQSRGLRAIRTAIHHL
jgi:RNA polymerase sigma-70 factor, ECF subfamily